MRALAPFVLVAFIAVLAFAYAITDRRRKGLRAKIAAQTEQITALNVLVFDIHRIARDSMDVDPSAGLIDHLITGYKTEETRRLS